MLVLEHRFRLFEVCGNYRRSRKKGLNEVLKILVMKKFEWNSELGKNLNAGKAKARECNHVHLTRTCLKETLILYRL